MEYPVTRIRVRDQGETLMGPKWQTIVLLSASNGCSRVRLLRLKLWPDFVQVQPGHMKSQRPE
jgi:hypothetical protein